MQTPRPVPAQDSHPQDGNHHCRSKRQTNGERSHAEDPANHAQQTAHDPLALRSNVQNLLQRPTSPSQHKRPSRLLSGPSRPSSTFRTFTTFKLFKLSRPPTGTLGPLRKNANENQRRLLENEQSSRIKPSAGGGDATSRFQPARRLRGHVTSGDDVLVWTLDFFKAFAKL